MNRREVIALLSGGAVAAPFAALAQTRARPLVGFLLYTPVQNFRSVPFYAATLNGMRELGQVEGRTFDLVVSSMDGRSDRADQTASDLVALKPDVIIGSATLEAVALKKATNTIPIVIAALADPVAYGFAASDARPGGNITGISPYVKGLPAKQLELAREIVPTARRIGLLDDGNDPKAYPQRMEIENVASALGLEVEVTTVHTPQEIGPAFQDWAKKSIEVVIVEQSNMLFAYGRKPIAEAAEATRIATVCGYREHADLGGLISYGVNLKWCFQRAAYYVNRILKGDKVGDLPIEFPTRLEMVINLKTAKAIGLTVPPMLLARADEVIE